MAEVRFDISSTSTAPLIREYPYLIKYAASVALNDTAFDARRRLMDHMRRVFNNPRPFTVKSAKVMRKSTPKTLNAMVGLEDTAGKGTPPDRYLYPQIYGGSRGHKRFEKAILRKFPAFGRNTFFIPAQQNKQFLDQYGDLKGSVATQMLAHLQAFGEQGYKGNIKNPKRALYFPVIRRGDYGMLPPGIYKRDAIGSENFEAVVFAVRREPRYRKRFYYFETVEKAARMTFPVSFSKRFSNMARKKIREYNTVTGASRTRRIARLP